jgi:hypothetical protein
VLEEEGDLPAEPVVVDRVVVEDGHDEHGHDSGEAYARHRRDIITI